MKRISIVFSVILLLLAGCISEEAPETIGQKLERTADSCYRIEAFDEDGYRISVGSGFVLMESDLLFTCWHSVSGAAYLNLENDEGWACIADELIAKDEDHDIAVYRLPSDYSSEPLPTKEGELNRGDRVYAIASFGGIVNTVSEGIVSGTWKTNGMEFLLFTAPIAPGCSGGLLMDEEGKAIGMICRSYEDAQSMNFAIPIEQIMTFYNSIQD